MSQLAALLLVTHLCDSEGVPGPAAAAARCVSHVKGMRDSKSSSRHCVISTNRLGFVIGMQDNGLLGYCTCKENPADESLSEQDALSRDFKAGLLRASR